MEDYKGLQSTKKSEKLQRFEYIKLVCVWEVALYNQNDPMVTDLDLGCVSFNSRGRICDHVYSPTTSEKMLAHYGLPIGKLISCDNAIAHSGDASGRKVGEQVAEVIAIDLYGLSPDVQNIAAYVNSPNIKFSSLPLFVVQIIGVYRDGSEYCIGFHKCYTHDCNTLYLPLLERAGDSWRLVGDFSAQSQANIGEVISSLHSSQIKQEITNPLDGNEIIYRINDPTFNKGDDDSKYGSMPKAITYGLIATVITAFLRFGYEWILDNYFDGAAPWLITIIVYIVLCVILGITVQSQSSYKSFKYPILAGFLILVSIVLSDYMYVLYISSILNRSIDNIGFFANLTWWGWLTNFGSVILVPFLTYYQSNK